jgi:hypothetical protein
MPTLRGPEPATKPRPMTDAQCELMATTMRLILDSPESWDQNEWGYRAQLSDEMADECAAHPVYDTEPERPHIPCGTAFCFAGHYAVNVAGARPVWFRYTMDMVRPRGSEVNQSVAWFARTELGLPDQHEMFHATNSARRLVELCYFYSGRRVDLFDAYWASRFGTDLERRQSEQRVEALVRSEVESSCVEFLEYMSNRIGYQEYARRDGERRIREAQALGAAPDYPF